jgi:ribosomal protein L37AE/L43A
MLWGSITPHKPNRPSDNKRIGVFGNFNYQHEKKVDWPKDTIVVYGEGYCPNCQAQLYKRKQDGLIYCGHCAWNYSRELLKSEERKKTYDNDDIIY